MALEELVANFLSLQVDQSDQEDCLMWGSQLVTVANWGMTKAIDALKIDRMLLISYNIMQCKSSKTYQRE